MEEQALSHETNTILVDSPAQVDAGADLVLKVRVSCPGSCDLQGGTVQILDQDGVLLKELALSRRVVKVEEPTPLIPGQPPMAFEAPAIQKEIEVNETDPFRASAPVKLGNYSWTIVFPAQQTGEVLHETSSAQLSFQVKAHSVSLAVWDWPTPAPIGSPFQVKVGVKCSAECRLAGNQVHVMDASGKQASTAELGEDPLPQTNALYWTEVTLNAPPTEGLHSWVVNFAARESELPHDEASSSIRVRTARPPEQTVTVTVKDGDIKTPVHHAHILLGDYRADTDERGIGQLRVPNGDHYFSIAGDHYELFESHLEVNADTSVEIELIPAHY